MLRSGRQLLLFLVFFMTLMLAYSCAFFFAFGTEVYAGRPPATFPLPPPPTASLRYDYRGVSHAFISLFRLLLGDYDFGPLRRSNPYLAVFLVIGFIFSVYFVLRPVEVGPVGRHRAPSASRDRLRACGAPPHP